MPPHTFADHQGAVVNDIFYVIEAADMGGLMSSLPLYAYNPVTDQWTTKAPRPTGKVVCGLAIGVIDGLIYTAGGEGRGWGNYPATTEAYNPQNDSWITGLAPMPTDRDRLTGAAVNGRLYAIGGRISDSPTPTNVVEAYNPQTDNWETKTPMPTARMSAGAGVINGKIYVVDGYETNALEVYDPATDTWETKAPIPNGRGGGATVQVANGLLFVMGGYSNTNNVEVYDPQSNTWTTMAPMPTGRQTAASGTINDLIYVTGGYNPDQGILTTLEVFNPQVPGPPEGSIVINDGAAFTASSEVTLTLSAISDSPITPSSVTQMCFSSDNATWTDWEPYDISKSWALASGDGQKWVYVRYQNDWGLISTAVGASITLDTAPPDNCVLTINGGAAFTTSPAVTLSLSASDLSGVTQMCFSNDGLTWTAWEDFASGKGYTLPNGDGIKSVYVQFRDALGQVSSPVVSYIKLDTQPPGNCSIAINGGACYTNKAQVTLTLAATDVTGVTEMCFSSDTLVWSPWEPYSQSRDAVLSGGEGERWLYVKFRDTAGHESPLASASIILDQQPPTGTVVINGGDTSTSTATVILSLFAYDAHEVTGMRFSNDNITWTNWEAFANDKPWTLSAGLGTKQVYAKFKDAAGNEMNSPAFASITLTVADSSVVINNGASYTNQQTVALALSANVGSGVTEMRLSNDGSNWSAWQTFAATQAWSLSAGNGSKLVYGQFRDAHGVVSSAGSNAIILDTVAPADCFIVINNGAAYTNNPQVDLILSASDAHTVTEMHFSNDNIGWSAWEPYSDSKVLMLPAPDGLKTLYVAFRDPAGNVSAPASASINLDTTKPAGYIHINGGETITNPRNVALTLTPTDANAITEMSLCNEDLNWTAWQDFVIAKSWTLTAGDGVKQVFAKFKDVVGNVSDAVGDAKILVDTTAPTDGTLVATSQVPPAHAARIMASGGPVASVGNCLDWWGFSDQGSGIRTYWLYCSTKGYPDLNTGTKIFEGLPPYIHSGLTKGQTYYYRVYAVDRAGNISQGAATKAIAKEIKPNSLPFLLLLLGN